MLFDAVCRRLGALEERTDNLNQLVVDLGKSIEANTQAVQEQNATIERSFRELARGLQLIRDKQVQSSIRCRTHLYAQRIMFCCGIGRHLANLSSILKVFQTQICGPDGY